MLSSSESNAAALSEANKKAKVSFDYTFSGSCNVRISALNNKKTFSCIRVGCDHVSNSLSRYRSHIAGKPQPRKIGLSLETVKYCLNPISHLNIKAHPIKFHLHEVLRLVTNREHSHF